MKLQADRVQAQLSKGLSPVYFIPSDDPLQAGEIADLIRAEARKNHYEERESHSADARFDWSTLLGGLDNLSLFASKKIVEVRLVTGKPGREGGKAIAELVANPPEDTLFLFTSPRLDSSSSKTKWAKAMEQFGVWVNIPKVDAGSLPGWLANRMKQAGLQFEREAVEVLAARVEGNLLAAQQEIDKLALLTDGQTLTTDMVMRSVADGARYDVYQLADAAVAQDVPRATRILFGLQREGIPAALTMWALSREITTLTALWTAVSQGTPPGRAMKEARIWSSKQSFYDRAVRTHNETSIRRLVAAAGQADRVVKGAGFGRPWDALLELVLCISQPQGPVLAGYSR